MNGFFGLVVAVALVVAGGSFASADEQRVTFGMQCRFDDGRKAQLIAARQDMHFMMFRQVDGGWQMVRFEIAKSGALIFEADAGDEQETAAWRDAFAVLKKLPMQTIKAEEIRAFQAAADVPACGRPSFDWRTRQAAH